MIRQSRSVNIFGMSALDLFASGMGAFLLIAVMALPYYLKTDQSLMAEVQQLKQENDALSQLNTALEQEIAEQKAALEACQQSVQSCREQLAQTFLAVVMKWSTTLHDIDLHVFDPAGNEFSYRKHNRSRAHYPGTLAELSVDTTKGPGIEIWEIPVAKPGNYKVYYKFYARHGGVSTTQVSGTVYYRDGGLKLSEISLTSERQKTFVATISVTEGGEVSLGN